MNYRIKFRKVTKWQKFKDFNKKVFAAIKTFIINKFSGVKVLVQKVKNFNERINYSRLFNRIGIFILFLVPIFICLILCLNFLLKTLFHIQFVTYLILFAHMFPYP